MDEYLGAIFANRYRVIKLLSTGVIRRLYLADDISLDRKVTLALIHRAMAAEDDQLKVVMNEIDILSQVGVHENIVVLYDYGTADGIGYLVYQYMSGGTLDHYIQNREKSGHQLTVDEVRRLGRQLARALAHVHERGVIHNDVAPSNIWFDSRQVVQLAGFDSAVRVDGPALPISFRPPDPYASPEKIAGGKTDGRSDLYSFGAILYYALTGEAPLRSRKGLVEPVALREDIPSELNFLIRQLLADSPNRRPGTAGEILELLKPPVGTPNRPITVVHEPDTAVVRETTDKKAFVSWLEALPFPVASILWRYHAALEPQSKVDYLVKFFEALAQFLVVVQLSAYTRDRAFFHSRSTMSPPTGSSYSYRFDLRLPTFGTWVKLYQDLSSVIQDILLEESGVTGRCYELFAASSRDQIELLANPTLGGVLSQAQRNRNAWIGHGGVASYHEHARRLVVLEDLLRQTERILGATFETWNLLKPGYAAFTNGLYSLRAASLMGANSDFRQVEVPVRNPLDTNRLYLLNAPKTLELVPLMRVLVDQNTGQNAFYFFNRFQAGEVRWISYHYEVESERILYDSGVVELLSKLR
jgi:serine/threonine protein kinase